MPRNPKCRRVCAEPQNRLFLPKNRPLAPVVVIRVEELEAMRLCDLEGMDQDAAANCMEVSRATFGRILALARQKIAKALVEGKGIDIHGGHYTVGQSCPCQKACRHCHMAPAQKASHTEIIKEE